MRIVAGRWRGRTIKRPADDRVRPTADRVREAWMSIVQPELPDARVLDLFAGSGALGLEALSRGAAHCDFIEIGARSLAAIRANVDKLGAEDAVTIVRGDAWFGSSICEFLVLHHSGPASSMMTRAPARVSA